MATVSQDLHDDVQNETVCKYVDITLAYNPQPVAIFQPSLDTLFSHPEHANGMLVASTPTAVCWLLYKQQQLPLPDAGSSSAAVPCHAVSST